MGEAERTQQKTCFCQRTINGYDGSASLNPFYLTGEAVKLGFSVHPHMLRHSCGFMLANDGKVIRSVQYYLGHKNIQNSVPYTQVSPSRFKWLLSLINKTKICYKS